VGQVPDADAVQVKVWSTELGTLHARVVGRFARPEPGRRALAYLQGLLSQVDRKNSWHLAEHAGELTPDGMQRLLNQAGWDADAVRDELRSYVVEHLGDPRAVLVVDETGFCKKGTKSVGVARQYTGTAGRIENSQVGVFLAYASPAGHALVDRELYLPRCWTDDLARCAEAGVPDQVGFHTKPQLAQAMLERALTAGVPAGWVTGDTIYGGDRRLRIWLEERAVAYVLAVKRTEPLWTWTDRGPGQVPAERLLTEVPAEQWLRISAGQGPKGKRFYDWARVALYRYGWPANVGFWLLARRSIEDPKELAFYACFGPASTPLVELVRVAGVRWAVEEAFQQAKGEVGLDHYQVRRWTAWYRHITLALLAHAFLAVVRTQATTVNDDGQRGQSW
jgi:SRSO17 transposase